MAVHEPTATRVTVARLGAMNHYLTPVSLARQGMLERFYTDLYLGRRTARLLRALGQTGLPGAVRRLAGRTAEQLPDGLVTTFPAFGLNYWWRRRAARGWGEQLNVHCWAGRRFCELILRHDPGRADVVYAYSSAALELLQAARSRGQLAVLDHITAPLLAEQRLVEAAYQRYPGWTGHWVLDDATRAFAQRQLDECQASDLVLCLSSFARDVLVREGVPAAKIAVLPPALSGARVGGRERRSPAAPLRVLFVGNDPLRKGLPDLVAAARLLHSDRIVYRAVGANDLTAAGLAQTQSCVEVLGSVPRGEMAAQYAWGDVLAFPTVSDTFGIVILEAMRAGMVVITTPHSGGPDVIRDGVDGFLVPPHSPEALATKLDVLAGDRALCAAMGQQAQARAAQFTAGHYAQQLAGILQALRARSDARGEPRTAPVLGGRFQKAQDGVAS